MTSFSFILPFWSICLGLLFLLLFCICYINGNNKKSTTNLFVGFLIIFVILNLRLIERLPRELNFNSIILLVIAVVVVVIHSVLLFKNLFVTTTITTKLSSKL